MSRWIAPRRLKPWLEEEADFAMLILLEREEVRIRGGGERSEIMRDQLREEELRRAELLEGRKYSYGSHSTRSAPAARSPTAHLLLKRAGQWPSNTPSPAASPSSLATAFSGQSTPSFPADFALRPSGIRGVCARRRIPRLLYARGARRRPAWWLAEGCRRAAPTMRELRRRYDFCTSTCANSGNAGSRANRLGWMHILKASAAPSACSTIAATAIGGLADQEELLEDGEAAAAQARGGERRKLMLWGESIGSGVAVAVVAHAAARRARRRPAHSSCVDVAAAATRGCRFGLYAGPLRLVERAARLPRSLPTLSIHGRLDDIAPIELGRRLHASLPEGAAFVELPDAGHNDVPYQDPAAYLKAIAAFFERLE